MPGHSYRAQVQWSGSTAAGYADYPRAHTAYLPPASEGLDLSADESFKGDPDLPNPEQLLVLAASSCQMLSFLAIAARRGVDVQKYEDDASGEMPEFAAPKRITRVTLRPKVTVASGTDVSTVQKMLYEAHRDCYIANSLKSETRLEPTVVST
jgi:organic hydroperoxide reductase OsmC/OhrA